jgi:transcription elongation GreA/GreB family factor
MTSNEPPLLTREGRARLEERARRLEEETIPALVEAIDEEDDEMAPRVEQDLAQRELEQLKYVLETAGNVYDIPEDPDVVQVGDWVTVKTDDGEQVRHLIVHPAEAGVDTDRISSDSPFAAALLGKHVSEEVTIEAPSGTYLATIIESSRSET